MIFDSIADLRKYVEGVMDDCAQMCAQEMLEIMREEIQNAYFEYTPKKYFRTGQLLNTPQIILADSSGMTTEFVDNGDWFSVYTGEHFFALEGLEGGTTWGRGATTIHPTSVARCQAQIPDYYARCMRAFGIPIT